LLPTAHQGSEVHFPRAFHTRYVPPSGFGYPLDGFLPPSPCRSCFIPTALLGFTLRSLHPPESRRTFPLGRTHLPFLPPRSSDAKHRLGPADRGSWALPFPEIPGVQRGFKALTAGYSPGFRPFQGTLSKALAEIPPGLLSRALRKHALAPALHRRLRVSIGLRLPPPSCDTGVPHLGEAALIGFLHRLTPIRSGVRSPGLCVHLASRRASPPAGRRSLDDPNTLPQPMGPA
jgi:hypothetical protein